MEFEGTSDKGDFNEALQNAITAALKSEQVMDAMLWYRVAR